MRILVVEDRPRCESLSMTERGRWVDVAADGEEGLPALGFPIDVAIVDLGLPKRSAVWRSFARSVRQGLAVLVLTARDSPGQSEG